MSELLLHSSGRLATLCKITTKACVALTPMILQFYSSINSETSKLKSDASVFTIADGIVQHLLINHLFVGGKFADIVGEEDPTVGAVDITNLPYRVEDLFVPADFSQIIDDTRRSMDGLSEQIDPNRYKDLTIFIDPIDGTREFSSGLGEQCSVCIGFADLTGKPVAGVVYRPITTPPTYAAGALSEVYTESQLNMAKDSYNSDSTAIAADGSTGLLTSNGGISAFSATLIKELGYHRVPSGGAGNKMLMLLEGKGSAYIQDRGVSRWDTAAAQAILEAHGGCLSKLTSFARTGTIESYTYLKSSTNRDFEKDTSNLTAYNCMDKSSSSNKKGSGALVKGTLEQFAPYSNLCGLLALRNGGDAKLLATLHRAIEKSAAVDPPSYD